MDTFNSFKELSWKSWIKYMLQFVNWFDSIGCLNRYSMAPTHSGLLFFDFPLAQYVLFPIYAKFTSPSLFHDHRNPDCKAERARSQSMFREKISDIVKFNFTKFSKEPRYNAESKKNQIILTELFHQCVVFWLGHLLSDPYSRKSFVDLHTLWFFLENSRTGLKALHIAH